MIDADAVAHGIEGLPIGSARFELMRRSLLQLNDMGIALTHAMYAAGVGDWASNVDLAALAVTAATEHVRPRDLLGPTRLTRGDSATCSIDSRPRNSSRGPTATLPVIDAEPS